MRALLLLLLSPSSSAFRALLPLHPAALKSPQPLSQLYRRSAATRCPHSLLLQRSSHSRRPHPISLLSISPFSRRPSLFRSSRERASQPRSQLDTANARQDSDGPSVEVLHLASEAMLRSEERKDEKLEQGTRGGRLLLTIGEHMYDLTDWAASHPGGLHVIEKSAGRNVTAAFLRAGHSRHAHEMLANFLVDPAEGGTAGAPASVVPKGGVGPFRKLFTHEDRFNVHKSFGIFVLLHYIYRYTLSLTFYPAAGYGAGQLRSSALIALGVHAALSCSSLPFPVPRARVVGKPMIWSEFRAHNIIFAMRSVICCLLTTLALNGGVSRRVAVLGCALAVPASMGVADLATAKLRVNNAESTTATMPYWDGCSNTTQGRFKLFYAYCQVMATLGCLSCTNPVWPLLIMLPIQLASLLMTLVRKGLLSTRGYHYLYTASLFMPFVAGLRHAFVTRTTDFLILMPLGSALLLARRSASVNRLGPAAKYALWAPVLSARLLVGDLYLSTNIW